MNKPNDEQFDEARNVEKPVRDIDPFANVDALRLSPETSAIAMRPVITRVAVRKPGSQEFFRVHPDDDYRLDAGVIFLREERETYLVHPHLRAELADEMQIARLYTCISRDGAVFLWAVPLPGPDGRRNGWYDSAHAAADQATKRWTRIKADMSASQYTTWKVETKIPDPGWPEEPFIKLLKLAFKDTFIDTVDHPVVQRLRGLR